MKHGHELEDAPHASVVDIAHAEHLKKAFGTEDMEAVCVIMLTKGELQVSDKERAKKFEELFHVIATTIVEKVRVEVLAVLAHHDALGTYASVYCVRW